MANSVKIENPADFRKVAAEHGVVCSTGKGRLPARDLMVVLRAKGIEVEPTPYFDGKIHAAGSTASKPSANYAVSARVPRRDATGGVKLNGKGEVVFGNVRKVTISPDKVRELTDAGSRGRLSDSNTLRAAAEFAGWLSGDELADVAGLLKDAKVERIDTVVAVTKPTKPKAAKPAADVVDTTVNLDAVAA